MVSTRPLSVEVSVIGRPLLAPGPTAAPPTPCIERSPSSLCSRLDFDRALRGGDRGRRRLALVAVTLVDQRGAGRDLEVPGSGKPLLGRRVAAACHAHREGAALGPLLLLGL